VDSSKGPGPSSSTPQPARPCAGTAKLVASIVLLRSQLDRNLSALDENPSPNVEALIVQNIREALAELVRLRLLSSPYAALARREIDSFLVPLLQRFSLPRYRSGYLSILCVLAVTTRVTVRSPDHRSSESPIASWTRFIVCPSPAPVAQQARRLRFGKPQGKAHANMRRQWVLDTCCGSLVRCAWCGGILESQDAWWSALRGARRLKAQWHAGSLVWWPVASPPSVPQKRPSPTAVSATFFD